MSTWVAFLRAINLGPRRRFSPAEVKAATQAAGFTDVATHINTGNVLFSTTMRSPGRIGQKLEQAYADDRGFEVPVVLMTPAELRAVGDSLAEVGGDHDGGHFVWLLRDEPPAAVAEQLAALGRHGERVVVRGRAVHLLLAGGYQASSVSATKVEKLAGVATNRNSRVLAAIAEKWC